MLNKNFLTIKKILPLFIFVLALVATSSGNIEPPEPWWRGNEGTTFQMWLFSDDNPQPEPETDPYYNDYGDPGLLVDPHPDNQHPWYDNELLGATGVWVLSGEIDTRIPNRQGGEHKEIYITLVWKGMDEQGGEWPYEDPPVNDFLPYTPLIGIAAQPFEYMDMYHDIASEKLLPQGWHQSTYIATIWPNPSIEWISIKGNILVDALAIETYCVPEPATIAILMMGGLWAIRRRKYKS